MEIYVSIFILVILLAIFIIYKFRKNKPEIKSCLIKDFNCVKNNIHKKKISEKERIIDYDKLYHKILLEAGNKGTFGEILKRNPNSIKNINKIWELHKIRNTLVHEIGYPKGVVLFKVALDYKNEVNSLLNYYKK